MELRKCKNCGAFINSESDFCNSCSNILSYNRTILKSYFEDATESFGSVPDISEKTGIAPSIIQNYMVENNYIDSIDLEKTSFANLPY